MLKPYYSLSVIFSETFEETISGCEGAVLKSLTPPPTPTPPPPQLPLAVRLRAFRPTLFVYVIGFNVKCKCPNLIKDYWRTDLQY